MIIENIVKGSKNTSFHDFEIGVSGMDLTVSKGSYFQAEQEKIKSDNDVVIPISSPTETTHFEMWITETGIQILTRTDSENFAIVDNPIDRLAWFTVPTNTVDLNGVDIHIIKVAE